MENKETINENFDFKKEKSKLLKLITGKKFLTTLSVICFFLVIEFTTDMVEIVVGGIIELTNPFRPKAGTIWELNEKDQLASDQLQAITQNLNEKRIEAADIRDLFQLKDELKNQQTILITAAKFKTLYNQMPPRFSYDIISPFDLLKLSHNRKWTWTKIIKSENSLNFYFLDGDNQLLMDTYPPLTVLYNIPNAETNHNASLDSMAMFKGRTFTADKFFAAFDDFTNVVKLQLINNPYLLIKWDNNIRKVGISQYTIDNTVMIGFEINQDIYTEVYTFEASELAANYLIARINEIYPALNLHFPERKYREYHYYQYE